MGQYVVAVSIDKVQSFIYDVLQAYIQENQANSGTLKEIVQSSNLISKKFYNDIGLEGGQGEFSGHITETLLVCSGICIFVTSLDQEAILGKLDRLFTKYYKTTSGKLLIKYVYFEKDTYRNADKLEAIKKSKRDLRSKDCMNNIISRHQSLLFEFCDVPKKESLPDSIAMSSDFPAFSDNINELFTEDLAVNDNHFRIAVIKADLDGMGDLFASIDKYPVYQAVSKLLTKYISLETLHEQVQKVKEQDESFKLYPLYMAGDDIFFAVPAHRLLDGVSLCKNILKLINLEISDLKKSHEADLPSLTMSIGIDITFNREPIRYYYDRVQHQVEHAKAVKKDDRVCMKISINNYVFKDSASHKKLSWCYFQDDVRNLQGAMKHGFAAHHYLYGLLNKIPERSSSDHDITFSNAVLYHLLPKHMDSGKELREYELAINTSLLEKLFVTKQKSKRRIEKELCFSDEKRKRLKKYIQLLLLFTDQKLGISKMNENRPHSTFDKKRVRSTLFNKTLRYLYDHSLILSSEENISFRDIFVESTRYEAANKPHKIQIYRTLRITSSMFHKLKRMNTFNNNIEIAADLIQSVNDESRDDIRKLKEERTRDKKAPPGLFFDRDQFIRIANHTKIWTEDYIDSLLIFYRYKELSIRYKNRYASHTYADKKHRKAGGTRK